jgi:Tol biopolymer transport system component
MKWLGGYRMRWMLVGFVAISLFGSGRANADFTFGEPTNLGPMINSSSADDMECITTDGLELFLSTNADGYGRYDIYVSTRATTEEDWGPLVNLGPKVNTPDDDGLATISADGLSLYFHSFSRPGGLGLGDIWVTTRPSTDASWGDPIHLGPPVNSAASEGAGSISIDGLEFYFFSSRSGAYASHSAWDLWSTTRAADSDPWGQPVKLELVSNRQGGDVSPSLSADGRLLFFSDAHRGAVRPGGYGSADIWVTRRATILDPWDAPVNLGSRINTSAIDWCPCFSADERTLYFSSNRPGGLGGRDIWQAPILPVVDFDGDGQVNIEDLTKLVEHWGQNEPTYDIGPMPWGDGVVDSADLEVLMSHWGQKVYNPHLLAHWMLDESEGDVAYDSAGENDAVILGEATWAPEKGHIDGTLNVDGVDDHIQTPRILNPAEGAFSVFAWIKGGAPGQVVLSQENGVSWLMADAEAGTLRSELSDPVTKVRGGTTGGLPILTQFSITDGNWHRVGFVWDGIDRILYVDDVEVARDTVVNLESANGGLYIGASSGLEPGTFWSGMIDDVRIYNRVVEP